MQLCRVGSESLFCAHSPTRLSSGATTAAQSRLLYFLGNRHTIMIQTTVLGAALKLCNQVSSGVHSQKV